MQIPRSLYRDLAAVISRILPNAWPHLELLAARFNVPADTVVSIYSYEAQRWVALNHSLLKAATLLLTQRYLAGEDVLDLAYGAVRGRERPWSALPFPPCSVIRILLQQLLELTKQRVTEVMREPALLRESLPFGCSDVSGADGSNCSHCARAAGTVSTGGSTPAGYSSSGQASRGVGGGGGGGAPLAQPAFDPRLLERLEADVERCVAADWLYSPRTDAIRHVTGLEAEALLCAGLAAADVPFWSEEALRDAGYIKTPDVRLQIPVALPSGAHINWIDSKATFGDEVQHRIQLADQYRKYVNRYGPGAIIYWSGFVEELATESKAEHLTLLSELPENLMQLPRLSLQ